MKPSHRSTQLLLKSSRPLRNTFICPRCRTLPQFSPITTTRAALASADDGPKPDMATRLRRRIWGTDTPPGQKDPYARLSPEERAAELLEQQASARGEQSAANDTATEIARRQSAGEYQPAENWEGLERIGGATGWWEEEWDRNNVYRGFLTQGVLGNSAAAAASVNMQDVVRRVAVEILALKQAGASLLQGAQAEWSAEELVEDIDIVRGEDGGFVLREQTPDLIDELVELLQRPAEEELAADDAEDSEALSKAEEEQLLDELRIEDNTAEAEAEAEVEVEAQDEIPTVATTKTHDPIFLDLPLTDLAFKFALIKRLTYLLGTRIPDPKIASFKTLADVVTHLSEKPAPTKLAEMLREIPALTALPNVEIFETKRTFVHKEMEIGRWKVIEAELRRRGLPIRKSDRVYR